MNSNHCTSIVCVSLLYSTLCLTAGCGDEAMSKSNIDDEADTGAGTDFGTDSQTEVESPSKHRDPGTIVYLDVTSEDGEVLSEYHEGHPIRVTVRIDPADNSEEELLALDNMHIGLVTKLAQGQDRSEGSTCYLGQVYDHKFGYTVTDVGDYEFVSEHYIPEECLDATEQSGVFNLWIAIDPARDMEETDAGIPSSEDHNTQFFTDRYEDLDGDRNMLCLDRSGTAGCVLDLTVTNSPGHNIELKLAEIGSRVLVISPDECSEIKGNFDHELEIQTHVVVHGSDHFDGASKSHAYYNMLEANQQAELTWELCPAGEDGSCIHDYMKLSKGEAGASIDNAVYSDSHIYNELVAQRPYIGRHNLHVGSDQGTTDDLCDRITGAVGATENWSQYQMFNVRACINLPFAEAGHGEDEAMDNCTIEQVRMVVKEDTGDSNASLLQFRERWSQNMGTSIVGMGGSFGTNNYMNLSGAFSQTYGVGTITGWMNKTIIDLYFEARAWVSIVGSGVDSHIDVFGTRYWEYSQNIAEVSLAEEYSYSKRFCINYNYGIAGIGLNASLCASGSAGLDLGAEVSAVEGAGVEPFAASTRIGQVVGTAEPYTNFTLSASASLNVAVARGGVTGTLLLLDVRIPGVAQLNWGLVDGPELVIVYNIDVPLQLSMLSGHVNVWVDLYKPKWCSCKPWWCPGYPCGGWDTVVDKPLVSFSGVSSSYTMIHKSGSTSLL